MNDPALQRGGSCLCPIAYIQLAKQAVDVCFDRGFGDVKVARDFLVTSACDNPLQYFELAGGQSRPTHALGELFGDKGWNLRFAGIHRADRGGKFVDIRTLEEISLSPGLQRAKNVLVAIEGGQHNNARPRRLLADERNRVRAAKLRQAKVHQGY